jgi:NADPH2:quinone reductase
VQVGKALGARVIAVVSDDAKADLARNAGADDIVLTGEAWRERVLEASLGACAVSPPRGASSWSASPKARSRAWR